MQSVKQNDNELLTPPMDSRWDRRPLGELIEFLLTRYHEPLRPELNRLREMSRGVAEANGGEHPSLVRLADVVSTMAVELDSHLGKEENILFPWLLSGNGRMAAGPVNVMQREHDAASAQLAELRTLTSDFEAPADADDTWVELVAHLAQLDRDLREHMHLENNILFLRALTE